MVHPGTLRTATDAFADFLLLNTASSSCSLFPSGGGTADPGMVELRSSPRPSARPHLDPADRAHPTSHQTRSR